MPISWNEVRDRAIKFSREWVEETREHAEAKSFWDGFFNVFGIQRRTVATFESPVLNLKGQYSYIDLFWPGKMLAEHKSRGSDLDKAQSQAFAYIRCLVDEGRMNEVPRYVIVSDFARVVLYDLEPEEQRDLPLFDRFRVDKTEFSLTELHKHVRAFAFIKGEKAVRVDPEDPANVEASEIMAQLHDALEAGGFTGHDLERFLVRILFCLFADDTSIFNPNAFQSYVLNRTTEDGSDLGLRLARLFEVLDTPLEKRQKNLDEDLAAFQYVNGDLFKERLAFADFNRDMRNALISCTRFDWSKISPAVFGSLFQGVMEKKERRQQGAHYTSERDIMKVVRSLFLDDFQAEFAQIKADKSSRRTSRLKEFHKKLCNLRFLDPACGCGNFLVLTYRELRLLELAVLKELHADGEQVTVLSLMVQVDVDQFYGIEIAEWPVRIAEVALWLMDHQMNIHVSEAFENYYSRLPLKKSPTIVHGNALRMDWNTVLPKEQCSYLLGNPPFIGKQYATPEQKADMQLIWGDIKGSGVLDYVTAWYRKAVDYIEGTSIHCAFVSTNSITQGEQVGILWTYLFNRGVKIHFAHRTFSWTSEARGKAHVHVVIIGFGLKEVSNKRIYDYEPDPKNPSVRKASNISPYLVDGASIAIVSRTKSVCKVPEIIFGSMPNDGGHLLLSSQEKAELLAKEPEAKKFIRPLLGSEEFINGKERWCLWLVDAKSSVLRSMPSILERIDKVREHRLKSERKTTNELAKTPTLFGEIRQPISRYLAIPSISSERRSYIPMAFLDENIVGNNKLLFIPKATAYHFGVLSSIIHMVWVRQITGRLKSDFQYSNKLVYNNYPWPIEATDLQKKKVEECAQVVLDAREPFLKQGQTLADLYDPLTMPSSLLKAHQALDRAVDRCYRKEPFENDRQRVEFLFALYEKLAAPLLPKEPKKRKVASRMI